MTHAEFELELVEALNMLLEDERASVEMEIALASGATEYSERDALTAMGVEDIRFCEQLRTEMELAGLPVTPQINGVVFHVIGAERYDDRLRAFAQHQRVVAGHARELQESNLDGELREALEGISATHERHSDWIERRADAFAATRTLEFGAPNHLAQPPADAPFADDTGFPAPNVISESVATPAAPADDEAGPTNMAGPLADELPAEAPVEEPPAKPRAARAAKSSAAKTKPAVKSSAGSTAKTKPAAKSRSTTKATPPTTEASTPRRARRASAQPTEGEA